MSIQLRSQGILDTIQDQGRYGHSASGINPGGAMDRVAATVANYLVGNSGDEAVIELHYPAGALFFDQPLLIAISGADLSPSINGVNIPLNTPVITGKGSELVFQKPKKGARCYVAVHGGLLLDKWLGSYSTNLKAQAGGLNGRALREGDTLKIGGTTGEITNRISRSFAEEQGVSLLPWHADVSSFYNSDALVRITKGNEYRHLTDCSATIVEGNTFSISLQSDRMGYRMNGSPLQLAMPVEMISSAVTRGTVQLLPNGQLIILMADHQATGGYPRLAHIISADIPTLAQMQPNTAIRFKIISLEEAESLLREQYHNLQQLRSACAYRLMKWEEAVQPLRS